MKHTKKCPKCSGETIIDVTLDPTKYRQCYIPVGFTLFSAVPIHRLVCCDCGYSEEWIDQDDIPALREKYPRVF